MNFPYLFKKLKCFFATSLGAYQQQQEQNNKMFEEIRIVAEEIVASIRLGKFTDSAEFIVSRTDGCEAISEEARDAMIGMWGGVVTAHINDILNDEKMSLFLKANYQFVAIITKKIGNSFKLSCGFISNIKKKEIKKLAKESNGRIKMKQVCDFCTKVSPHLQKCGACRSVFYCCKEHQTADWKDHKKECKRLVESKE